MPTRTVSHRRLKKYGIGDLRDRITMHVRSITAPGFSTASFSETYDVGINLWASVTTFGVANTGEALFSDVNLSDRPSHKFVIRYLESITTENVIRWQGRAYKLIAPLVNPEGRNEYLEIFAKLLGDEDLEANK